MPSISRDAAVARAFLDAASKSQKVWDTLRDVAIEEGSGKLNLEPRKAELLFLLDDASKKRVIGTGASPNTINMGIMTAAQKVYWTSKHPRPQ